MSKTAIIGLGLCLLGLGAVLWSNGIEDRHWAGTVKFLAGSLLGAAVGYAIGKN